MYPRNRKNSERKGGASEKGRIDKTKRKVMLASHELLFLKQQGAQFLPELDAETFAGFSRMAGEKFSDAWISREAHQQVKKETYMIESTKVKRVTFVTSDLINALSAIAEDLDTIFLSRLAEHEKELERTADVQKIARLVMISAVLFEEIRLSSPQKTYRIKGIWKVQIICLIIFLRFTIEHNLILKPLAPIRCREDYDNSIKISCYPNIE